MTLPWVWRIPEGFPQSWIAEYDHDVSPDFLMFLESKPVPSGAAVPTLRSSAKPSALQKWDVLPNSALVPLVNQRVADLLQVVASGDIQLMPARLLCAGDAVVPGYYLVNVLRTVRGVDWSRSEAKRFDGGAIQGFKRLSFLSECLRDAQLALEEEYPSILLVGEELVRKFKSERVKGAKFERAEDVYT